MKSLIRRIGIAAGCGLVAAALLCPARANAYAFIYHFDIGGDPVFSGTPPAGPAPWINLTFEDAGAGNVFLTISNVGLTGSEKLTSLYLNLDPALDPTSLTFTPVSSSAGVFVPNLADGSISEGVDAFKADGDGKYDVLLDFSTTPGTAFTGSQYIAYQISGITGLNALNFFKYLSLPAGTHGPFFAAAHVQSIGADNASGWIAPSDSPSGVEIIEVPEPASASLLLLALGAAWFTRRAGRNG